MGWWPFSNSNGVDGATRDVYSEDVTAPPKRDFSLTDEQRTRIFGRVPEERSASGPAAKDPELDAFLKEFGVEPTKPDSEAAALHPAFASDAAPAAQRSSEPAGPRVDETGRRINPDGSLDISPDALYPRTMNCTEHFDRAHKCGLPGSHFMDVYRYGSFRDCSEQWAAWRFCMRIRVYSEPHKQELISDYYKRWEERKKKEHGSSEDVWEIRTKAVESAFGEKDDVGGVIGTENSYAKG